uniref:Uncharacterized protein n=1 Tax=Solanum lycopersicum TaxID=4081 RepID=A0A3Q7FK66_SOLLC
MGRIQPFGIIPTCIGSRNPLPVDRRKRVRFRRYPIVGEPDVGNVLKLLSLNLDTSFCSCNSDNLI